MENLLVATDLSVRSDRAVGRAIRIAARLGARLTVLHVVDEAMPHEFAGRMRDDAQAGLERFCAAQPCAAEADVEVRVEIGDPVPDIVIAAARSGAELLVLGLHRERQYLDMLRETTAERLIRASRLPVLLVRDPADHDYGRMLAAVDVSPASAEAASVARLLAPDAAMAAFHAYYVPFKGLTGDEADAPAVTASLREAREELARWRAASTLPEGFPEPEVLDEGVSDALEIMLLSEKPDLLSIGAHGRSTLARWLLGGFAAELVRRPPCDLVIAHPRGSGR